MADSLPVAIGNAVCVLIAGAVGGAFHADGSPFTTAETIGVAFGPVPDSPSQAVGVTPYPVSDVATQSDGVLGIQVWFRAPGRDIRPLLNMQQAVFDLLQNQQNYRLGGQPITLSWREVTSPQGTDSTGRFEYADTYYFRINRPLAASFN